MEAASDVRPLPGLQAVMAELVADGKVAYAAGTATWFEGAGPDAVAKRQRGRTLRDLSRSGVLEVDESAPVDERGARPVRLTVVGAARYGAGRADDQSRP
jgi:hypothetical protein